MAAAGGGFARGNREVCSACLITPYRPMTMASVAGKDRVTHVGKL